MANEISLSASVQVSKNGATFSARASKNLDQSGAVVINNVQTVGTSAEAVNYGDVAGAPAVLFVQNLDATNFVELSLDSGFTKRFLTLRAGEFALINRPETTVYAKANTAACNLLVLVSEA